MWGGEVSASIGAGNPLGHFLDGIAGVSLLGVLGVGTRLPHAEK